MTYFDPFVKDRFVAMLTRHEALLGSRHVLADHYLNNDKTKHLGVRRGAGSRQGLEVKKEEYVLECAPGTVFTKPVLISGSAIISGAIFTGSGDGALITISGTGKLLLQNCILSKEGTSAGSYVSVSATGKLQANGCMFTGAPGGGSVVSTAGGDAGVTGTLNVTGRSHGAGVAVVGEIT